MRAGKERGAKVRAWIFQIWISSEGLIDMVRGGLCGGHAHNYMLT